ncbi:hypothetical protein, partial [Moorena sp. SIO3I6]
HRSYLHRCHAPTDYVMVASFLRSHWCRRQSLATSRNLRWAKMGNLSVQLLKIFVLPNRQDWVKVTKPNIIDLWRKIA